MGNCFGRKKKNRVGPEPEQTEDIHAVLSRSTDFQKPSTNDPVDMVEALKKTSTALIYDHF